MHTILEPVSVTMEIKRVLGSNTTGLVGGVLLKIVFGEGFSEEVAFKPNLRNEKEPATRRS